MTETYSAATTAPAASSDDRTLAYINYVLLMISPFTGYLTAIVALVLAYIKVGGAHPIEKSHFNAQISLFWWQLFLSLVAVGLFVAGVFAVGLDALVQFAEFGEDAIPLNGLIWMAVSFGIGGLMFVALFFWMIIAPIIGMGRLSNHQPNGRMV
ncbi:MAG: hypothetical protein ACK41P_07040 [Asticcacaulis sp.]